MGGSVLGGGGSLLVRSGGKLGLGVLGGCDKVGLGECSGRAVGVEHLLPHLGTSLLGREAETLDLRSSLLGVLGDLGGNAGVHRRLGLGVEILEFELGSGHARLATGNGLGDRGLELLLVRLHDGGEHGTALGRLDGVGTDDAGELVHLLLELLVVLDNGGVEGTEALAEILLGSTEGILNIEAGLTGLGGKRSIGLGLELLALGNSSIELTGLLLEHVSGMRTVLLHGATDLVELLGEVDSHAIETGIGGGLVLVDEGLELLIVLEVLLVALVTKGDHALHLSCHVVVHLSLGKLVLLDNTGKVGDAGVGLRDLAIDGGTKAADADLETSRCSSNTGLGLGLSRSDVLDRLGELRVTQSLLGVERRGHAGGGRLEEGIGMRTVGGHLGANTTEVSSSRGNDDLELVVSPLANSLILGCELGPTLLGLLAGVGGLLIEDVHSLLESLAG